MRGFNANHFSCDCSFARPSVVGSTSPAATRYARRNDRASSTASRPPAAPWPPDAYCRTLAIDATLNRRSAASGKRAGAQRLHRGIRAGRDTANSILHRPVAVGGYGSRIGYSWPRRRLYENSQSRSMQYGRSRD
jgi:hypothetical protein